MDTLTKKVLYQKAKGLGWLNPVKYSEKADLVEYISNSTMPDFGTVCRMERAQMYAFLKGFTVYSDSWKESTKDHMKHYTSINLIVDAAGPPPQQAPPAPQAAPQAAPQVAPELQAIFDRAAASPPLDQQAVSEQAVFNEAEADAYFQLIDALTDQQVEWMEDETSSPEIQLERTDLLRTMEIELLQGRELEDAATRRQVERRRAATQRYMEVSEERVRLERRREQARLRRQRAVPSPPRQRVKIPRHPVGEDTEAQEGHDTCGVCFTNVPRMVNQCGHSLCVTCSSEIYKRPDSKCPQCREPWKNMIMRFI
jgi:hypothetical protein